MASLSAKRAHIGLSRLARFASASGIEPGEIDDTAMESFIAAVRGGSLHRNPNHLHRKVTLIWNEVARLPGLDLKPVTVPSFRGPAKRIDWTLLPASFCKDVGDYLQWCGGSDPFAADARPRALSPKTLRLRRDQIHAAVTALVESDIKPASITSLAELVSPGPSSASCATPGRRGRPWKTASTATLAKPDPGRARRVKVDVVAQAELKRLVGKMPIPVSGLTDKNKRFLRQFDDPAAPSLAQPARPPWAEISARGNQTPEHLRRRRWRSPCPSYQYMPLATKSDSATFGKHLFLREEPRAILNFELSASPR